MENVFHICCMKLHFQKKIRQHYYSAMSYTDSRVGLVLEQLDKSGFADDTIIVLLGDHGTFERLN